MTEQEKDKLDIKIDENTCSPSWLKESRKVVGEPER
jgi:hypothetical protein